MAPLAYVPGHPLSTAELSAARLDGDLAAEPFGYVPVGAPVTRGVRAAALEPLIPGGCAAEMLAAAWVHGACAELPARIRARRVAGAPLVGRAADDVRLRARAIRSDDVEVIGRLAVTTPERTAYDLWAAALAGRGDDDVLAARAALLGDDAVRHRLAAWLDSSAVRPYARAMRAELASRGVRTT